MNGDWEENVTGSNETRKYKVGISKGKINGLLTELLEKEEEIQVYKTRLKELETAFYYNLELISERDLELSILEKQLDSENDRLQDLIRERNELEDLVRAINNKNNKKIKQLETKLSHTEEELRNLQREKTDKISNLKRLIDDIKHQEEKKINKMITQFETQKTELIRSFQEEMEEKEKYYLLEIDNLSEKLTQACLEKDQLIREQEEHKNHLEDLKKVFIEKENQYIEEIKKQNNTTVRKINKDVQCDFKPQIFEKETQARPNLTTNNSQTNQFSFDMEIEYIEKLNFLQEQNEVLKHIVKDLKKNRDAQSRSGNPGQPPGCECLQIKTEVEQINKKFETEINNLKEILEEEQKRRKDEDVLIQNLERSVTCLKDKFLSGLQEKLQNIQGEDICTYTYNREIQTEIQVTLLEEKLSMKIDSLMATAEEENKKVHEKLEELKQEWANKIEKFMNPRDELKSENLLEKIRQEIQKLEYKIETDMKNLFGNNKCDKNLLELPGVNKGVTYAEEPCKISPEPSPVVNNFTPRNEFCTSREIYYKNDLCPEKFISIFDCNREFNSQKVKKFGGYKGSRKMPNNLGRLIKNELSSRFNSLSAVGAHLRPTKAIDIDWTQICAWKNNIIFNTFTQENYTFSSDDAYGKR